MLQGHESSVPAENRVRQEQRGDLEEALSANGLPLHCQPTSLVIIESGALLAVQLQENPVLFDEVVNHVGLVAIEPTGGRGDDHLQRRKDFIHAHDRTGVRGPKRR